MIMACKIHVRDLEKGTKMKHLELWNYNHKHVAIEIQFQHCVYGQIPYYGPTLFTHKQG